MEQHLSEDLAALAQNYTELIQAKNELRADEVGSREEQPANITQNGFLVSAIDSSQQAITLPSPANPPFSGHSYR